MTTDGQHLIVQVDKDFAVTGTQSHGRGGRGPMDGMRHTPDGDADDSGTSGESGGA